MHDSTFTFPSTEILYRQCCCHLERVRLSSNSIGKKGAKYIAKSEYLTNLTYLNLKRNGIDCKGVQSLANSVYLINPTELDLSSNQISDKARRKYIENSEFFQNLMYLAIDYVDDSDDYEWDPSPYWNSDYDYSSEEQLPPSPIPRRSSKDAKIRKKNKSKRP